MKKIVFTIPKSKNAKGCQMLFRWEKGSLYHVMSQAHLTAIVQQMSLKNIRKALEKDGRFMISFAEFQNICNSHCPTAGEENNNNNNNNTENILDSLFKAGDVLKLSYGDDNCPNIILKPHLVYEQIYRGLLETGSVRQDHDEILRRQLQIRIQEIEKKLSVLQMDKDNIDDCIRRQLRRWGLMATCYLTFQTGILMYSTWFLYGWEVTEPWSYFISFSVVYVSVLFYTLFRRDYEYIHIYDRVFQRQQQKLFKKFHFDYQAYLALQQQLSKLKLEYQQHLSIF